MTSLNNLLGPIGQLKELQCVSIWCISPEQVSPPLAGGGLLHSRSRCLDPPPQVAEQVDQCSQWPQLPSTSFEYRYMNFKSKKNPTKLLFLAHIIDLLNSKFTFISWTTVTTITFFHFITPASIMRAIFTLSLSSGAVTFSSSFPRSDSTCYRTARPIAPFTPISIYKYVIINRSNFFIQSYILIILVMLRNIFFTHQHLHCPCSLVRTFLQDKCTPMVHFHSIPHNSNREHIYHN